MKKVVVAINYALYNIGKIRKYLDMPSCECLMNGLMMSRLDYCNALFYGAPEKSLDELQRLQNRAARILKLTPKFSHITPVLKDLHWLPVRQRIDYKIILMVFKCLNGYAPEYLSDLITPHAPSRALRTADLHLLKLPGKTRLKTYGDRCFEVVGTTLWN